ncbi:hypothetical protein Lalb_Chr22g0359391 [Lupinus albus]|uniref:Uncharacterized protein n=1 Tax=Lupinus albus TaxID=3870 RepID=A0A6A4NQC0_LUPAL|nr:hypothetical protein Lalb_Chr22g0359391 [Lupinus albus]
MGTRNGKYSQIIPVMGGISSIFLDLYIVETLDSESHSLMDMKSGNEVPKHDIHS